MPFWKREKSEPLKLLKKKLAVDMRESTIEIRENGKVYILEIMRDKNGVIWGVYPNRPDEDIVFVDGVRNLLIAFKKGILKLEDLPRRKEEKAKP